MNIGKPDQDTNEPTNDEAAFERALHEIAGDASGSATPAGPRRDIGPRPAEEERGGPRRDIGPRPAEEERGPRRDIGPRPAEEERGPRRDIGPRP